jgi:hypothetical protein
MKVVESDSVRITIYLAYIGGCCTDDVHSHNTSNFPLWDRAPGKFSSAESAVNHPIR